MIKVTAARRDFLFLMILIVMIRVAVNQQRAHHKTNPSLVTAHHQKTEYDPYACADTLAAGDNQPFFHPADKHVLHHIDTLFEQVNDLIAALPTPSQELVELKGMRERILYIKRKYQHTSPAIALLGPIGSTGVVLQEQKYQKELLKYAQRLGIIVSQLVNDDEAFISANTVSGAIENNRLLLAKFHKGEAEEQS